MDLTLDDTDRALVNIVRIIFGLIRFNQCFSAVYRQGLRETVSADCYNTYFYFWQIVHDDVLLNYVNVK